MHDDRVGVQLDEALVAIEDAAQLALAAAIVPGVERTGVRTVEYQATTASEMIRCLKTVCTMISEAIEAHYG